MLFKNLQFAAHPCVTHHAVERRHQIGHKAKVAHRHHRLVQFAPQSLRIVAQDATHEIAQLGRCTAEGHFLRRAGLTLAQTLQGLHRLRNDAPGPMTLVEQALDDPQLFNLLHAVTALAKRITPWLRKAVAAFPDSQSVLANARVTFYSGNRQAQGLRKGALVHEKIGQDGSWELFLS